MEHGRKFAPVRLNVTPELPAVALAGEINEIAGVGRPEAAVTVKSTVFEVAWPFVTVTAMPGAALANAMSEAEIVAVS